MLAFEVRIGAVTHLTALHFPLPAISRSIEDDLAGNGVLQRGGEVGWGGAGGALGKYPISLFSSQSNGLLI